jgi:hypothetical protein
MVRATLARGAEVSVAVIAVQRTKRGALQFSGMPAQQIGVFATTLSRAGNAAYLVWRHAGPNDVS